MARREALLRTFVSVSGRGGREHRSWSVREKGLGYSEPSNKRLEFTDENKDPDLGTREWAAS